MRIAYMGTPDFAVPALKALADAGHEIAAVYCQPPRPAGRGKKLRPSPVQAAAEAMGLTVRHPVNFKDPAERAAFAALDLDVAVVAAYGLILPQEVLDAPRLGCWNIHASLLPRWRGAAPIHRAIMAGDEETGICIMAMEAGLDTGPVGLRAAEPIRSDDTTLTLHDRLAELGAASAVAALDRLARGALQAEAQSGPAIYAPKIDKAEARIDWTLSAEEVDRRIRGLSPFPGAWFELEGERVKVLMSALGEGVGPAGAALDERLTIACGEGAVRLLRLQRAGAGAVSSEEFLRGRPVSAGGRLT